VHQTHEPKEEIMLKLNASYSKKVPTEEKFSSQSYLASVEVELPHGMTSAELRNKIHDTFELVKLSVENEIASGRASKPPLRHPNAGNRTQSRQEEPLKATNNQIGYILKLAQQREKGLAELNEMASDLFRVASIYELTRRDASSLLDQLKSAA
jgi:hypothetical protein